MKLLCESKRLFGIVDGDTIELSCRSKRCGYEPGVVVLHRFDLRTGELVGTKKYRNPRRETKQ